MHVLVEDECHCLLFPRGESAGWVNTAWKDEFFMYGHPLAASEEIIVSSSFWSAAAPQLLLKIRD